MPASCLYASPASSSFPAAPAAGPRRVGWATIRFVADNPGVWLLHCHIEWHMHAGLQSIVIEGPASLYAAAARAGGSGAPSSHAQVCRTYINSNTVEGGGGGFVATRPAVVMGADSD